MMPRHLIIAVALSIALVAGAFVALRVGKPAVTNAALVLAQPAPVPAFSLLDQHGKAIDERVFAGQWDLVFFGFTHCPDVCPTTLQVLATARRELAESGFEPLPRIVLVSVDPERDTPDVLGPYVRYFGEGNLGITGSLEEISKLASGLGIFFEKQAAVGDGYGVDHSAAVLLIDSAGGFRAVFGTPHASENYVHDLPIIIEAG